MKRKLLITAAILLTGAISHAQDANIEPSLQAQGYLHSKNGIVDHTTGIFHYKVPLYEIKVGNFTLPITLDYASRGVKTDDSQGLLGYNWTLNTGGVVTRIVKGGIPDEKSNGRLFHPSNGLEIPSKSQLESVNKRHIDGESDIFTAVFNGKSVNFIIQKNSTHTGIVAVPIERTNVKIESLDYLDGWRIIDEDGSKYTFKQKEYLEDVAREGTTVGISCDSYVSAWYLTSIEPIGVKPIIYTYATNNFRVTNNSSHSSIKYKYGKPMYELGFYFEQNRDKFNSAIMDAAQALGATQNTISDIKFRYDKFNTIYPEIDATICRNSMVMGILFDIENYSMFSNDLLNNIANLINNYDNIPIYNNFVSALIRALRILEESVKAYPAYKKEAFVFNSNKIKSPILKQIDFGNEQFQFQYNNSELLSKINKIGKQNALINSIEISSSFSVDKVSYLDKNGQKHNQIKFEYYPIKGTNSDCWGYATNKPTYFPINESDITCIQQLSLKNISMSSGESININYECNKYQVYYKYEEIYGGLRIKSLEIKDNYNNCDSIKYHYPELGIPIYSDVKQFEIITYDDNGSIHEDTLYYSRVVNEGTACITMGNNGLYYPYVREEFVGKGSIGYLFFTQKKSFLSDTYPYWLSGLSLGKVFYDNKNRIVKMEKNKYYDQLYLYEESPSCSCYEHAYFEEEPLANFHNSQLQIYPLKHYLDSSSLSAKYKSMENIVIYKHNYKSGLFVINPYNTLFRINIEPRLKKVSEEYQIYELRMGGKLLLKERTEYVPTELIFGNNNISDFENSAYQLFRKKEYVYKNLNNSILPTMEITTNSNEDKTIVITKRVSEIETGVNPVIDMMKERNMWKNIIKQQTLFWKKNESQPILVENKVYEYTQNIENNRENIGLKKVSYCSPNQSIPIILSNSPLLKDDKLYDFIDETNYNKLETFDYTNYPNSYLLSKHETNSGKVSIKYDPDFGTPIFKGSNIDPKSYSICDLRTMQDEDGFVYSSELRINTIDPINKYKLYFLYEYEKYNTKSITYEVVSSEGVTRKEIMISNDPSKNWHLECSELDLSEFNNVTSLRVVSLINAEDIPVMALTPANSEFEAMLYNSDGTILCKFNQNCQMERYEYDTAGRMIRIFDENGILLKEFKYNILIN